VFYLCYTEYRNMFPLLALSTFEKVTAPLREEIAQNAYFSCAGN
jgi:hypothetical protein